MLLDINTKRCKKYGGDLYVERDEYGIYIACIQCGAIDAELAELTLTKDGPQYITKSDKLAERH